MEAQAIAPEPPVAEAPAPPPARGWKVALGLAAALGVAAWARLAAWSTVVTERGVRLAFDSDPYYHLLQAERILAGAPVSFDPFQNWPDGQRVVWPPLFDALIAGVARLAFGADVTRGELELAAALVPVPLGLATVALAVVLGALLLGRWRGIAAAFLVAVLPAAVLWSSVGAADQHVVEILLYCGVIAAFVGGWRAEGRTARRAAEGALAVAIAASFWNWQGSAFNLVVPVLFTGAVHVLLPADGVAERAPRALAAGLGAGAALLAVTLLLLGPPGALGRGELSGITGLHVAIVAGAAAFGALLLLARARRAQAGLARRVAEVALALIVPAAATLGVSPALRHGVLRGLTALAASDPWYPEIAEYRHLLFSCFYSLSAELRMIAAAYGLTFLAAILAVPALVRRAREGEEGRAAALLLACWAFPLLALALLRWRFAPYLSVPLALLTAEGLWWAATRIQGRHSPARPAVALAVAFAAGALVMAPVAPTLRDWVKVPAEGDIAALEWLGTQPSVPGREGVLSTWHLGHFVRYFGRKPAVASPFGTEGSMAAMVDTARFDLATDPNAAGELLRRRRVGYVVLSDPMNTAIIDQGFFPGAAPVVTTSCSIAQGRTEDFSPAYFDGVAARLFHLDGRAGPGRRVLPIDQQRLVYEADQQRIKIFAVTEGAALEVRGAPPGGEVVASVQLRTNQGRPTTWSAAATADAQGVAALRVPYATGLNGAVVASTVAVRFGGELVPVTLSEADVTSGRRVPVSR